MTDHPANDSINFEQISQSEACGRATGLLMCFIGDHMKRSGSFPSPSQLGEFADQMAYEADLLRPEIKDFFHGIMEAISATLEGGANATL